MAPKLERIIEAKGYVVLGWSEVGFVRFFSTKKFASLAEMQDAKMFCWEGDPASAEAWRAGGFHPVVMSSTDIVPGLQTGLIDTVALAPLYAYSSRMFEKAKYMLDLPWAVLTGAHGGAQGRVGQGAGRREAEADRDLARVCEEDRARGAAHGHRGAGEHGQAGPRRGEADRSGRLRQGGAEDVRRRSRQGGAGGDVRRGARSSSTKRRRSRRRSSCARALPSRRRRVALTTWPHAELERLAPLAAMADLACIESNADGTMKQVTLLAWVPAPPSVMRDVIVRSEKYREFIPNLSRSTNEPLGDGRWKSAWRIELPVSSFEGTNVYSLEQAADGGGGDAHRAATAMRSYRYEMLPVGEGTLLVQYGYTDVKHSNAFVRSFLKRQPMMEHGLALSAQMMFVTAMRAEAVRRAGAPKMAAPATTKAPSFARAARARAGGGDARAAR